MKRITLASMVVVFAAVLAIGSASPALADDVNFQAHWSGAMSRTASNIIADPVGGADAMATVSDLTQKGTFGESTVRVVAETGTQPAGYPATARCPDPAFFVEYRILAHSSVTRLSATGELLYTLLDGGSFCVNPLTGQFTFSADVKAVGGTGRFAHATGTGTASGSGQILLAAADGNLAFASLDGNSSILLHLPDED